MKTKKALWLKVIAIAVLAGCLIWGYSGNINADSISFNALKESIIAKFFSVPYNGTHVPDAIRNAPSINFSPAPPRIEWAPGPNVPSGVDSMAPEYGAPGMYNFTNFYLGSYPFPEILAGSLSSDSSQGIIVFVNKGVGQVYKLPINSGPSTFTSLSNGQLTFITTNGVKGIVSTTSGQVTILP